MSNLRNIAAIPAVKTQADSMTCLRGDPSFQVIDYVNESTPSSSSSPSIKHSVDCPCNMCTALAAPAVRSSKLKFGRVTGAFKGLKPVKATLTTNDIGHASAAATAMAINDTIILTTGNFPELASFMVVYDLMRIVKGRIRYVPLLLTAGGGLSFGAVSALMDQTSSAPSTVEQIREETFSSDPFMVAGALTLGIQNQSKFKVLPFHFSSPTAPVGTNTNCGNDWFVLDSTNAPHIVQVQAVLTALTGTGVTQLSYYVELDCEFKMRT